MGDLGFRKVRPAAEGDAPAGSGGAVLPAPPARCGTPGNAFAALADWGRMP
jgi:hypothetical protein